MTNRSNTLQTTATSLEIVEYIKDHDGAQVNDLVAEFDVSRSTVHNHLATLREKEYVITKGNTYHLGLKFFHLGRHTITRRPSYDIVSETVGNLAAETDMEVDFSVEEYGRVIVIFDKVQGTDRSGFQLGDYIPMHACAAGKAILAEFSRERVDAIIDRRGLSRETDNTITDREVLYEELETVRERGYAINDEESHSGIQAVATVIAEPNGTIMGALSVADPTYRYPAYEAVAAELLQAAARLEERIEERWERELLPQRQPDVA